MAERHNAKVQITAQLQATALVDELIAERKSR
jgi:hypothetical protein